MRSRGAAAALGIPSVSTGRTPNMKVNQMTESRALTPAERADEVARLERAKLVEERAA